jgi:hypothetical protein
MAAGSTYTPIATTALTSGTSYSFTSIPSTYTDLILVTQFTVASNLDLGLQFNANITGTSYSDTQLVGNGTTAASYRDTSINQIVTDYTGTGTVGDMVYIFNIMNYSNATTYKTVVGTAKSASKGVNAVVGTWRNTAAINELRLLIGGGGFTAGIATIYGIAAA